MKYYRDYAKFKRKKFLSHSVVDLLNNSHFYQSVKNYWNGYREKIQDYLIELICYLSLLGSGKII